MPPSLASKGFVVPTLEEVKSYCKERNNRVDATAFWNFYESKGWLVGKTGMKNWHSAIATWEQRDGRGPVEVNREPRWEDLSAGEQKRLARYFLREGRPIPPHMEVAAEQVKREVR